MTEDPTQTGAATPTPSTPATPPAVFDTLREQYNEVSADRRTTISIVPGRFSGNLAARYMPVDWKEIRKKAKRAARGGMTEEDELNYGASVIAAACETILIRMEDGAPMIPLNEAYEKFGSELVRYDARLAEAIGIPDVEAGKTPQTAVVRLLFKNPAALNDHFAELDAWLKEATPSEDDEAADGEGSDPT